MVYSITRSTGATLLSLPANSGLATTLGLVVAAMFIFLLVTREMAGAEAQGWVYRLRRGANIAIYPLGMAFALIAWSQLGQILG